MNLRFLFDTLPLGQLRGFPLKQNLKNFIAAFLGTALEFYDFALYGFFATTISRLFFPDTDPIIALIASYSVFAAGFIMRPLGGIVFGYIGDNFGRKKSMLISIIAMMIPTCLMGLLPTYDDVGLLAPMMLALCRLLQGLCAGGEFSGAAIFVIEHSIPPKKFFSGSLVTASSVVGMLLASSLASFFTQESMPECAWRIPFLLGIVIGLLGIYIRKNIQETEDFRASQKSKKTPTPFIKMLLEQKEALLITLSVGAFIGILYYVPFVFMGHYLECVAGLKTSTTLLLITSGLLVYMGCIGSAGYLADRWGGDRLMKLAALSSILLSFPAFFLLQTGHFGKIWVGVLILSALAGTFVGPANGLTAHLFETQNRCRGVSFSLSLGISLFGGITPIVLTWLIDATHNTYIPSLWLLMGGCIGYAAVCRAKKITYGLMPMTPTPSRPSS